MSEQDDKELEFDSPFGEEESGRTSRTRIDHEGAPIVPPPPPNLKPSNPEGLEDADAGIVAGSEADLPFGGGQEPETDLAAPTVSPEQREDSGDEHIGWKDNAAESDDTEPFGSDGESPQDNDVFGLDASSEARQLEVEERQEDQSADAGGIDLSDDSGEFLAADRGAREETTGQLELPMTLEEASIRLQDPDFGSEQRAERPEESAEDSEERGPLLTMSAPSPDDFTEKSQVTDAPPPVPESAGADESLAESSKSWIQRASEQTQTNVFAYPLDEEGMGEDQGALEDEDHSQASRPASVSHSTPRDEDFLVSEEGDDEQASAEAPASNSEETRPEHQGQSFGEPLREVTSPRPHSEGPEEFVAVIESRNTKTRMVKLTQDEFSLAEKQILENRVVHISGKALVLDAVAISRSLPEEGSRRRRRARAA